MLVRALIVLLLVLNLGVAVWWIARDPRRRRHRPQPPPGVARLQLVGEATVPRLRRRRPRHAAPRSGVVAGSDRRLGAGPDDCSRQRSSASASARSHRSRPRNAAPAKLQAAGAQAAPRASRAQSAPARGWRVFLPPLGSPGKRRPSAQRIGAAGFSDFLVVREGAEANSIALGRYRSEDGARKRMPGAGGAAGFAARVEAVGDG